MSNSRYDNWVWESCYKDDYNDQEVKYSGEDIYDAYLAGKRWYDEGKDLLAENESLRNLLDARARLDKALPEEEKIFINEFMNKYDTKS